MARTTKQEPNYVSNFSNYIPKVNDNMETSGSCTHYLMCF